MKGSIRMIRKIVVIVLSVVFIISLCCVSVDASTEHINQESDVEYVVVYSYLDLLDEYYQDYVEHSTQINPNIELMTFEEFTESFYEQDTYTISEYLLYLYSIIDEYSSDVSSSTEEIVPYTSSAGVWYNMDITKGLEQAPSYGKFDFSKASMGDILYEDAGFGGLTGHIAFVEGWFYDSNYSVQYIRVIESILDGGVCRGYLDDDRFIARKGTLLKVDATNTQKSQALYFISKQLGKPWVLQPFTKPTSIDHTQWQCSTLVWAAYNYAGVDVEQHGIGGGTGVTPHDIRDADTTTAYLSYN